MSCGSAAPPVLSLKEEDLGVVQMCSVVPEQDTSLMFACTSAEGQVMRKHRGRAPRDGPDVQCDSRAGY